MVEIGLLIFILVQFVRQSIKLYKLGSKAGRFIQSIRDSQAVGAETPVGTTVNFSGDVVYPDNELTPFGKQPCSYYQADVFAEFKTKQKAPDKGYETHRPKIFTASSDDKPLIVSNGQHNVQILLESAVPAMTHLHETCQTMDRPPSPQVSEVAQPKHKKFIVKERWLPPRQMVTIIGTVADSNHNCLTVTAHPQGDAPFVISAQSPEELMDSHNDLKINAWGHLIGAAIIFSFLYGFLIHYDYWSWVMVVSLVGIPYYYLLPWMLNKKAVGVGS
jgi:hypothetical protein